MPRPLFPSTPLRLLWVMTAACLVPGLAACNSRARLSQQTVAGALAGGVIGEPVGTLRANAGDPTARHTGRAPALASATVIVVPDPITDHDYRALMTPGELAIAEARATTAGYTSYTLTEMLTEAEKQSLLERARRGGLLVHDEPSLQPPTDRHAPSPTRSG